MMSEQSDLPVLTRKALAFTDIYMSKFGSGPLLQKLCNWYVAKEATKSQKELAKLP